jgi:NADH:ubiquinone oxidoreductase subunit 3 (subunit A)
VNHWPFIIAAYGLVGAGTGGLLVQAILARRAAERILADAYDGR